LLPWTASVTQAHKPAPKIYRSAFHTWPATSEPAIRKSSSVSYSSFVENPSARNRRFACEPLNRELSTRSPISKLESARHEIHARPGHCASSQTRDPERAADPVQGSGREPAISPSEVSKALKRWVDADLLQLWRGEKRVNRSALLEFLLHGLKSVSSDQFNVP
jgi:hypothetical protein